MTRRAVAICMSMVCAVCFTSACSREVPQKTGTGAVKPVPDPQGRALDGEALFKQYCATCHPDGGNVNDPKRNLRGSTLRANHITSSEDIVRILRNPISRMIRFDAAMLPDSEARAIAGYVLKTFK